MLWLAGCDMKNTFHDKIGGDKECCECDNDSMIAMRQGDKKYSDTSALGKGDKEVQGKIFSAPFKSLTPFDEERSCISCVSCPL